MPDYERSRAIAPAVQTKTPLEDNLDDALPGKARSDQRMVEGILTRRMMKIHLSWKV